MRQKQCRAIAVSEQKPLDERDRIEILLCCRTRVGKTAFSIVKVKGVRM